MERIIDFDLQLFAEGNSVIGTDGIVNSNTGAVTPYPSGGGVSAEMKTFYDKVLIEYASPALVHDQFAQKRPIPAGSGKTVEFRKFNTLEKALTAIKEGVTPDGNKLTVVPVTAALEQYGDYIEMTDLFELTAIDRVVVEATRVLADQAGRTMDTVVRNVMLGGTNVNYCPKNNGGSYTDITSRSELDSSCLLRVKDVFRAAAELKSQNAPTFDGYYVAIIHPYVAYDLMQEAGDQWVDIAKYSDPSALLRGEIGTIGGVRFVQSSEAKIYCGKDLSENARNLTVSSYTAAALKLTVAEALSPDDAEKLADRYILVGTEKAKIASATAGLAGTAYITLEEALASTPAANTKIYPGEGGKEGVATFATLVVGRDAYGSTEIEGGGIEQIVKQKGYGNDPLNQRSSVGWKAVKAAARLAEPYMIRVESGSTFSSASLAGN